MAQQQSGRNEGDWGHRPMGVSGDLSAPKLLAHYAVRSGSDYHLTAYGFQDFIAEMEKDGRIPTTATPAEGAPGLWVGTVNIYGTPYENAVGYASLYFDSAGHAIGYSYYWNFDHKAAGARPGDGELKTEIGSHIPG